MTQLHSTGINVFVLTKLLMMLLTAYLICRKTIHFDFFILNFSKNIVLLNNLKVMFYSSCFILIFDSSFFNKQKLVKNEIFLKKEYYSGYFK